MQGNRDEGFPVFVPSLSCQTIAFHSEISQLRENAFPHHSTSVFGATTNHKQSS